jgi:hypothetical protein
VKDHPEYYVVVLDASLHPPRFSSPSQKTYTDVQLRVCIHKPDYSKRYEVQGNYTDLKAPPNVLSISDLIVGKAKSETNDRLTLTQEQTDARNLINACRDKLLTNGKELSNQFQSLVSQEGQMVSGEDAHTILGKLQTTWMSIQGNCVRPRLSLKTAVDQLQQVTDASTKAALKPTIDIGEALKSSISAWDKAVEFAQKHISAVDENVFTMGSRANTEAEVVVRSAPLVMTSATKDAGKDDEKTALSLSYGPATDLARYTFQIRGLSYVRFGFSLGYSSVQNQGVTTGRNDTGSEVLRTKQDMGLTSMILMTHYWCGADEREIQPWDRSRGCWWANLLPTIAVGLPITAINTFQHIFLGAVWQPVPAIGLVGGAHLGRVDRMRAEFSDGMALPAGNTGFRPEVDTIETVTKIGWYVGAVVTDAAFIKLFKDVALPKK